MKKAGISDAEEFDFSTTKILNNFSNYSSWHYRSKILSKMFPDETGELPIRADKHKEGKILKLINENINFLSYIDYFRYLSTSLKF